MYQRRKREHTDEENQDLMINELFKKDIK